MKSNQEKKQTKIQKANNISFFFKKYSFITAIIDAVVLCWFSIVIPLFGSDFLRTCRVISISIFLLVAFYLIVRCKADYVSFNNDFSQMAERTAALYRTLLSNMLAICEKKVHYLSANAGKSPTELQELGDPEAQISEILISIGNCFAFLLSDEKNRFDEQDIYINMLYNFDESKNWTHIPYDQRGLPSDLLFTEKSFFTFLKHNQSSYLFYNSKQELFAEDKYIKDERDSVSEEDKALKGSILGYRININLNSSNNIKAMVFVSTFDRKFVEDNNRISIVKENIKKVILKQFEARLKIELCNLYRKVKDKEFYSNYSVKKYSDK